MYSNFSSIRSTSNSNDWPSPPCLGNELPVAARMLMPSLRKISSDRVHHSSDDMSESVFGDFTSTFSAPHHARLPVRSPDIPSTSDFNLVIICGDGLCSASPNRKSHN